MVTQSSPEQTAVAIFSFIGKGGGVRAAELADFLGVEAFAADIWMKVQAAKGYLYRHPSGAYDTACPWPVSPR